MSRRAASWAHKPQLSEQHALVPCSVLPRVLQAYAGQLASFETSMWRFDHDPSLLSAVPCLQKLHTLKLFVDSHEECRNGLSWQPNFEQLRILDVTLDGKYFDPERQRTWDLGHVDLAKLGITSYGHERIDLRAIRRVRTASLVVSFELPPPSSWQEGRCMACCRDWKVVAADIRAAGYGRPPAPDDCPLCVADLVGALVVANACHKLRAHGKVMKLAE